MPSTTRCASDVPAMLDLRILSEYSENQQPLTSPSAGTEPERPLEGTAKNGENPRDNPWTKSTRERALACARGGGGGGPSSRSRVATS